MPPVRDWSPEHEELSSACELRAGPPGGAKPLFERVLERLGGRVRSCGHACRSIDPRASQEAHAVRPVRAFPWNDDLPVEVSKPATGLAWGIADRIASRVFSPRAAAAGVLRGGMVDGSSR